MAAFSLLPYRSISALGTKLPTACRSASGGQVSAQSRSPNSTTKDVTAQLLPASGSARRSTCGQEAAVRERQLSGVFLPDA